MERAQHAEREFAFGHRKAVRSRDDGLPITVAAASALAAPRELPAPSHSFPVRAGTFTPWRMKEAA
jgi:hypothetical protein